MKYGVGAASPRSFMYSRSTRCQGIKRHGWKTSGHMGPLHLQSRLLKSQCMSAKNSQFPFALLPDKRSSGCHRRPFMPACCLDCQGTRAGWLVGREPASQAMWNAGEDAGLGVPTAEFVSLFCHGRLSVGVTEQCGPWSLHL